MAVSTQIRRIENDENGTNSANPESENARQVRVQLLADELTELSNYIQQEIRPHTNLTSDNIFLTYGGATLYGDTGEILKAREGGKSINLFSGASLDLDTAVLTGDNRFLHRKAASGVGGTLTLIPRNLKSGLAFSLDELEIKSNSISGKANLKEKLKLGVSPRIEVTKFVLSKNKIEMPDARVIRDAVPASEEFPEGKKSINRDLPGTIITKEGIHSKKLKVEEATELLNKSMDEDIAAHQNDTNAEEAPQAGVAHAVNTPSVFENADGKQVVKPTSKNKFTMHIGGPGKDRKYFSKMHVETQENGLYSIDLFQEKGYSSDNVLHLKNVKKLNNGSYSLEDKEVAFRTQSVCLFPYFLHLKGITITGNNIHVKEFKKTIYRDKFPLVGHNFSPVVTYDFTTLTKEKLTELWNNQLYSSVADNSLVATNDAFHNKVNLPGDFGTALMPFGATAAARLRYYFTFFLFSVVVGLESAAAFSYGFNVAHNRIGFDVTNLALIAGDNEAITTGTLYGNAAGSASAKIGLTAGVATLATIEAGLRLLAALNIRLSLGASFHTKKGKVSTIDIFGNAAANLIARLERYTQFNFLIWSRNLHQKTIAQYPVANVSFDLRLVKDVANHKSIQPQIKASARAFNHDLYSPFSDKENMGTFLNNNVKILNACNASENNYKEVLEELKNIKETFDFVENNPENTALDIKKEAVDSLLTKLKKIHYKLYLHTHNAENSKGKMKSQREDKDIIALKEKLENQINTLNRYTEILDNFEPFITEIKANINAGNHPNDPGQEDVLERVKAKCADINDFRDDMAKDKIIKVFFTHRLRREHSHGKSAVKAQRKAEEKLTKSDNKFDTEYAKDAFAYSESAALADNAASYDLYKRYAIKHKFFGHSKPTDDIKKHYPELATSRRVAQKHLNKYTKKVQADKGKKHTLRTSKLQSYYLKLSADDRKKANPAFYKLYTSTTKVLDPRGIRKNLIEYSTAKHFKAFAEKSLTSDLFAHGRSNDRLKSRNHFIDLRKKYEDSKKIFENISADSTPEATAKLEQKYTEAKEALHVHYKILAKDAGAFTHRFTTEAEFEQIRKNVAYSNKIKETAAKGSQQRTKEQREESSVKQQIIRLLQNNEDGLLPLIKYERNLAKDYNRTKKLKLLTDYQTEFNSALNPETKYAAVKKGIDEYMTLVRTHFYSDSILSGNAQFLVSEKQTRSTDYEGKNDLGQGTAYDQMHKYGQKGNFFVRRANKNKLLAQTYLHPKKMTLDNMEAYHDYMISKSNFYDLSYTKFASAGSHFKLAKQHGSVLQLYKKLDNNNANDYKEVKYTLERAENKNIRRRYQNYLTDHIDSILTPERIVTHENSRTNYYYNELFQEESNLLEANNVKDFLDTDVVKEFYKDMIFDSDNKMSKADIVRFRTHDKDEAHNELAEKVISATALADTYSSKGFTTNEHISLGLHNSNAFDYLLTKVSLSKDLVGNELNIKRGTLNKLLQSGLDLDLKEDTLQKQIDVYDGVKDSLLEIENTPQKIVEPGYFNNNIYQKFADQIQLMDAENIPQEEPAVNEIDRDDLLAQLVDESDAD